MDGDQIRKERIERLLQELRYECERGILENEIPEEMSFEFVIPISRKIPDGVVSIRFSMRPVLRNQYVLGGGQPRLQLVTSEDQE